VRIAEEDDVWTLQLLRGALSNGTLGSDSSHEDAIKFFTGDQEEWKILGM
jgi:hypothetical protein